MGLKADAVALSPPSVVPGILPVWRASLTRSPRGPTTSSLNESWAFLTASALRGLKVHGPAFGKRIENSPATATMAPRISPHTPKARSSSRQVKQSW
jgi:hypothetical protein